MKLRNVIVYVCDPATGRAPYVYDWSHAESTKAAFSRVELSKLPCLGECQSDCLVGTPYFLGLQQPKVIFRMFGRAPPPAQGS